MATNRQIYDLQTLAKTSIDSNHFLEIASSSSRLPAKLQVSSLFPTFSTLGSSSESIWVSVTNGNQLNFKGIKSGDTGLLTVATSSNNVELTVLESGIDLSLCNNATAGFMSGMDFTGIITGENPVINGGTGLSTIAKGAILYADAADSIAAAASSTNGQILVHNSTTGIPAWSSLVAGDNLTLDVSGAGVLKLDASLSTMAAALDMADNNIDLGTGYISSDGSTSQGVRVTGANAYVGASGAYHNTDVLNIGGGGIRFSNTASVNIKPNDTVSSTAGQPVTIEAGSSASGNAGKLSLKGGTAASGGGNGGDVCLHGGSEAGGTAGSIRNYVYNGSGGEVEALTISGNSAEPNVTVAKGNLVVTEGDKGIVLTGKGTTTQATNHSTDVTLSRTAGVITLAGVSLAAGSEADFEVTNTTVTANSIILLTVQSPAAASATDNGTLVAQLDTVGSGSFNIRLTNPGAGATTTNAHKIHFLVIN